jgi:glyoxylase-like metal-dependent hydrolase (beta-lactamase superfamily II)
LNRGAIAAVYESACGPSGRHSRNAPGHTYGHTAFVVNSGGQTLFVGGDLVHHDIIIERPRMEDAFDTDRRTAIETRVKTMSMLSSPKMLSLIYHTACTGLGHFSTRGDGFRLELMAMDMRS